MCLVESLRRTWTGIARHPHVSETAARVRVLTTRILILADRRRRTVAVTGAVLLHLLFLLCLLPQTSKGLSSGGSGGLAEAGGGEGLALDLAALKTGPPADVAIAPQPEEEVTPVTPEAVAVTKTVDSDLSLSSTDIPSLAPPEPPAPEATPAEAHAQLAAAAGGAGQDGATTGAGDDLWAAIAPCWKRIAGHDALPVRLTVSFASNGLLLRAPEIVRDPTAAIDVHTQLSESEAIQALSECGAYTMAAGRENVTISFPRP